MSKFLLSITIVLFSSLPSSAEDSHEIIMNLNRIRIRAPKDTIFSEDYSIKNKTFYLIFNNCLVFEEVNAGNNVSAIYKLYYNSAGDFDVTPEVFQEFKAAQISDHESILSKFKNHSVPYPFQNAGYKLEDIIPEIAMNEDDCFAFRLSYVLGKDGKKFKLGTMSLNFLFESSIVRLEITDFKQFDAKRMTSSLVFWRDAIITANQ